MSTGIQVGPDAPSAARPSTRSLELRSLTKRFGDFTADDDISLALEYGEVHALVGENGAGKSTLMNMCFGILQPTSGEILVDGQAQAIPNPIKARELGIGMVHQHFKLVPSLTVAENVFLGAEIVTKGRTLDLDTMVSNLAEVSQRYGLEVDPTSTVNMLSAGLRQRVEILKALYFEAKVLILDEPTAVLTPQETDRLLDVLRDLADSGRSILLVTHKLREVMRVSDRFSVIRRGQLVATGSTAGSSEAEIASLMVGRDVSLRRPTPVPEHRTDAGVALSAHDLSLVTSQGKLALDGLTLDVRAGEITGIAGVEGNGQTELIEVLAGLQSATSGRIELLGRDVTHADAATLRDLGLAHIPEDRNVSGSALANTIQDNLAGGRLRSNLFQRGVYRLGSARRWAQHLIDHYDVRGASPPKTIGELSGGNMQKVVIARELDAAPGVVLAAQPTRGVDIGASEFIHAQLRDLAGQGAAVLVVSVELDELLSLADRILVMYRGQVVAEFRPDQSLVTRIGLAMAGAPDPIDAVGAPAELAAAGESPGSAHGPPSRPEGVSNRHVDIPAGNPDSGRPAPLSRRLTVAVRGFGAGLVQPATAVLGALAVGLVIILLIGDDPILAYRSLIVDTFSDQNSFSSAVGQATPLLLVAVSAYVAFRSGILNIGGEGQLYLGAFVSAIVALYAPSSIPGPLLITLSILAGGLAGAAWALVPGLLNAYLDVDILVSTLMFSYIGQYLTAYFVDEHLRDPSTGVASTRPLPERSWLPTILGQGGATIGIVIAAIALIVTALVLMCTRWGLSARFVGDSRPFARYLGIDVKAKIVQVMVVSGFLAGVAGAVATLGTEHRFNQTFSPGYGFIGLTVALLGRLQPTGIALAAILYGALEAGSTFMQLNTGVPLALVNVLQGVIILLTTASAIRIGRRRGWPSWLSRRTPLIEEGVN